MPRWMIALIGGTAILASFIAFILGLMYFIPVWIGSVALFLSILWTVYKWNESKRFKGF
ncbi:hypothetical protein [Salsuginibacillus kocurii]|uniref:hypothetical protein n=1 Tax=Salsuginibacillus kocurii TaxID=427078 RepID=UPI0003816770|nr:hypothetical protein [Salsuginibacillus kocurii]